MSGLIRFVILPLILWWLITGGYEFLLPSNEIRQDDPVSKSHELESNNDQKINTPRQQVSGKNETKASQKPVSKPVPPRSQKPATNEVKLKNVVTRCDTLKSILLEAEQNKKLLPPKILHEGMECSWSSVEKRTFLVQSLQGHLEQSQYANALNVTSLFKKNLSTDPHPYFVESTIYEKLNEPSESLSSFIQGYRLSTKKNEIDPSYFLSALKSLQQLGRVCDQINVMKAMIQLRGINEATKTLLQTQLSTLSRQCG